MKIKNLAVGVVVAGIVATMSWHGALAGHGDASRGKIVYEGTCIACHGDNGKGAVPGVPGFAKRLAKPDDILIGHVVEGFESPNAEIAMPAGGGNPDLTESEAHDVIRYIREHFGSALPRD